MQDQNIFPNVIMFNYILEAHGSIGSLDMGESILSERNKQKLWKNDKDLGMELVICMQNLMT